MIRQGRALKENPHNDNQQSISAYILLYNAIYERAVRDLIEVYPKYKLRGHGANALSKQEYNTARRWVKKPCIPFYDDSIVERIRRYCENGSKETDR